MENKSNAVIITVGPGMVKTSLIEQLSDIGFHSIKETGRSIIQKELKTDGNRLPWLEKKDLQWLCFSNHLKIFKIYRRRVD